MPRDACYLSYHSSIWNFGMISLQQISASLPLASEDPRLIFRVIVFRNLKLYDHDTSTSQTGRRTDRRTDGRWPIYRSNTALCLASRGKKVEVGNYSSLRRSGGLKTGAFGVLGRSPRSWTDFSDETVSSGSNFEPRV